MAEEENENLSLDEANSEGEGRSKKKLIIIIGAVVLLLALAAGAYFLFFSGSDDEVKEVSEQSETADAVVEKVTSTYVAMPRPFVFNVQDGKRDRLVQIKVQLMVRSNENATLSKKHIPLLEGTLVGVFSAASVEQLRSPTGKAQLRIHALEALNEATSKVENKPLIHAVLFTGFVLQ